MSDINSQTYYGSAAVTPSDTVADPLGLFAGLYVSATGTIKWSLPDGSVLTRTDTVPVGTIIPIAVSRVWSTGTSATVVGLYALPIKQPLNPGTGVAP
jgi:hypothetical protein